MKVKILWKPNMSILPNSDHPSVDMMFIALLLGLCVIGVLCVFFKPAYPEVVNSIVSALIGVLGGSAGTKSALSQAKPFGFGGPGSSSETKLETTVKTDTPKP